VKVRWIALGALVVVAAFAVALALTIDSDPAAEATKSRLTGKEAPAFDLESLDGERVSSEQLAGKVVLVNFWNWWCDPCEQEHPELMEFYERHRDDPDFEMVGIVREATEADTRDFVEEEGVPYTIALDPGGDAALAWGTRGQPETYMITADGVVAASLIGPGTVETFEAMLQNARGV
jgi:cytochrome c biogenesis protein CcmG, thiol:disulfide interchange protein DsbE